MNFTLKIWRQAGPKAKGEFNENSSCVFNDVKKPHPRENKRENECRIKIPVTTPNTIRCPVERFIFLLLISFP